MKDVKLIVWITQLIMTIVVPLVGFILLGAWLCKSRGWGAWALWAGIGLGIYSAVGGVRDLIRTLKRMAKEARDEQEPPVCFNDHD